MTERVVVVGTGHGGVQTVDALRRMDWQGDVSLIGAESHLPYRRPPLSKSFLKGQGAPVELALHSAEHYQSLQVDLRLAQRVCAIDRARRAVVLSSGESVRYDHLVLALGGRARCLRVPGWELGGIVGLRTMDDAVLLRERLMQAQAVVLIGGGFIGLELATAVTARGHEVTVLEPEERLLSRAVTPVTSEFLADRHRATGVRLRLGEGVARFVGEHGAVRGVVTNSGATVAADLVVVGVGAAPECDLANVTGLHVDGGIVVDSDLRTLDPAISAIGDCARFPEGRNLVARSSIQNAFDGATHVARRLTGRSTRYGPVPWFWTDQAGTKVQMAGSAIEAGERHLLDGDPGSGQFAVYRYAGADFVGGESVGIPSAHLAMRKALAAGVGPGLEFAC
ncbi:MAG: NAD(P)/FAD-dependent oxidoreductase [Sciscionella sp.]